MNAIDVSPDGRQVLVSVLDDHDASCRATTYSVRPGGAFQHMFDGAAASFSPDGQQVAYIAYALEGEYCLRTHLVIRQTADRAETVVAIPGGPVLDRNPPAWPLNWSPNGQKITFVADHGAVVARVGVWDVIAVGPATRDAATPPQAPVFLDDETVAAMTGCCVGTGQQFAAFPPTGAGAIRLFGVPAPVRSIRRDRGGEGLWVTTEDSVLWRWDGDRARAVLAGALITSG